MTISVPVRSLDTHELMPGDIYPHPAAGGIYSLSHREVCSLFSDHIMYICSALVILLLVFIAGVFFRKIMTSSVERKRNTASVISDAKPEVQSKPEYFHLSICVEGPASMDDSALSSLASRVVREAENLYIPGVNRRDSADDVFAWSVHPISATPCSCSTRAQWWGWPIWQKPTPSSSPAVDGRCPVGITTSCSPSRRASRSG